MMNMIGREETNLGVSAQNPIVVVKVAGEQLAVMTGGVMTGLTG